MNGRNTENCSVHAGPPRRAPRFTIYRGPQTVFDEWNRYPEGGSTRAVENGDHRVRLEPPRLLRSRYRSLSIERKKNEKSRAYNA